jgi:hypothetical protein
MKRRNLIFYLSICLIGANCLPVVSENIAESDPVLKPDVPKLDQSLKKRRPLKGGVQHSEKILPKAPLSGSANDGKGLSGKTSTDIRNLLRAKARADKSQILKAQTESGIGIIGVKFVMGLGRPPIIRRVFPGTPAWEQGLRARDIIVAVDGIPTYGLSKDEVYNMIIGTPHTPVTISFRRNSDFQVRKMERMDFNDITDPRVREDYRNM